MTSLIQGRLCEKIHEKNKLEQLTTSLFECATSGTSTRVQSPEEKLKPGVMPSPNDKRIIATLHHEIRNARRSCTRDAPI